MVRLRFEVVKFGVQPSRAAIKLAVPDSVGVLDQETKRNATSHEGLLSGLTFDETTVMGTWIAALYRGDFESGRRSFRLRGCRNVGRCALIGIHQSGGDQANNC